MDLSRKSIEILLDLIEIKMSIMQIHDKEDAKEYKSIQQCREQLIKELKKGSNRSSNILRSPEIASLLDKDLLS